MARQQRDVLAPLAQRRHPDRHDVEPIEQILAKPPGARSRRRARGWTRRPPAHRPRRGSTPLPARRSAPAARARSCPGSRAACRRLRRETGCRHARARRCRPCAARRRSLVFAAEQLDLEPVGPHRRAIDRDKRPLRRAASAHAAGARRPPCRSPAAPVIRTRLPVGATRSICWRSWLAAGEAPTRSSSPPARSRSSAFSRRSWAASIARATTSSSRSRS